VQALAQLLAPKGGAAKRKPGVPKMLVLKDIELLSKEAQAFLDGHLGEMGERETIIVATTSLAPKQLARIPGFRRDLWLRLSVQPVCLAPLSARRADVPLLADAMVSAIAERLRIRRPHLDEGATGVLAAAALTGNLTELETMLTSAILAAPPGQSITADALVKAQQSLADDDRDDVPSSSFDAWLEQALAGGRFNITEMEQHVYRTALARASGNLSSAARSLGLSRAQLAYRLNVGSKESSSLGQNHAG
jgi:transcriptional regulator with GAF, ATPase, and Fis domain